ncbi:MAG: EamA family transporter [Candidatus Planktophila sp.]|nr:EamA family transporter [Candidatus Planktophila sp.]
MFEIVAIFAAFTMGLGTFLTKGITTQISFLKTLGPLFLLNCFFTLPIALVQRDWIVFEPKILALHVSAAIASIIAGYFIFVIIVRSSASISSISSTLSPAVALVLAPIWLGTSVSSLQVLAVIALIAATLFPIRSSIPGLRLGVTIFFTLSAALAAGFVSVNVAVLGAEGVNISETFIVRQVLAGLFYIVIFPPRGLTKSDLLKLMQRTSLISVGSIASVYALQGGEIILMVSILATVSLWVLLFESITSKSIPDRSTIIAAVIAVAGIVSLRFVS